MSIRRSSVTAATPAVARVRSSASACAVSVGTEPNSFTTLALVSTVMIAPERRRSLVSRALTLFVSAFWAAAPGLLSLVYTPVVLAGGAATAGEPSAAVKINTSNLPRRFMIHRLSQVKLGIGGRQ